MAQAMKVKKGDLVQVLSGKDRGKQGRVLEARPRPTSNPSRMGAPQIQPGGVIEKAGPIPISNVMVVCPACNRPTRVGSIRREGKTGMQRVRVCRRADCRQEIDR